MGILIAGDCAVKWMFLHFLNYIHVSQGVFSVAIASESTVVPIKR